MKKENNKTGKSLYKMDYPNRYKKLNIKEYIKENHKVRRIEEYEKAIYSIIWNLYKRTYHDKKDDIIFDHSFAFRHRNNLNYPYRRLTEQELLELFVLS